MSKLSNASNFTVHTRIDISSVTQDKESLEFANNLSEKLKDLGYTNIKIDIAPAFGKLPSIPFEVTQTAPPSSSPIIFIYPENGWTSERNPYSPFFNETYTTAFFKRAISRISVEEITRRVQRFRHLNYRDISDEDLRNKLTYSLSSVQNMSLIPVNLYHHFHKNAQLFRISVGLKTRVYLQQHLQLAMLGILLHEKLQNLED